MIFIICNLFVVLLVFGMVLGMFLVMVKILFKSIDVVVMIYVDIYDFVELVIDSWIIIKVKVDLLISKNVFGIEVKVEIVNGVVIFSGIVVS